MDAYLLKEVDRASKHLREIEKLPLSERKLNQLVFLKAIKFNPESVETSVKNVLLGNWGEGEKWMAERIFNSPRMNRIAALTQLAAGFEWSVPQRMAIDAWKLMSEPQQRRLAEAVQRAIDHVTELYNE